MAAGDPAQIILSASGVTVTPEALEIIRNKLGLNDPYYVQYLRWLGDIVQFNFGTSYISGLPVVNDLVLRGMNSLKLGILGLLLLLMMVIPLGLVSAIMADKGTDKVIRIFTLASASIPGFLIGLMLLYLFGVKLRLISVIETDSGLGLFLPAFTLALAHAGVHIRLLRTNILEVLNKDYIKAAKAKGINTYAFVTKHIMKNAMLPWVTKFGITVGAFLGGSTVIEIVFSYRGLGTYIMGAVNQQNYPVIQAYVIIMAALIVVINIIVDVIYVVIDPRIKLT
jgi:ABC-type dipeptide/oligopeptide/nickel transport systems, permease components